MIVTSSGCTRHMSVESVEAVLAMERLQKQKELGKKMRGMMKHIVLQCVLVLFLLIVGYSNGDSNCYYQNTRMTQTFAGNIAQVQKVTDFWKWCEDNIVPNLYYNSKGDEATRQYDLQFLADMSSYRLGTPVLRQLRVTQDNCSIPVAVHHIDNVCTNSYSTSAEDTQTYEMSWSRLNTTMLLVANCSANVYFNASETDVLQHAACSGFIYRSADELVNMPYWGTEAFYSGGGYVISLGDDSVYASNTLAAMESLSWLDQYTRVVFVEFCTWNPSTNLFNQVQIAFEFTPYGAVIPNAVIGSVNLYRYSGSQGIINMVSEILCAVFIIFLTITTIYSMVRHRSELKSVWNWLLLLSFLLFYGAMALYAARTYFTSPALDTAMNSASGIVSFQKVVAMNEAFLNMFSLTTFVAMLNIVSLLRYNETVGKLIFAMKFSLFMVLAFLFVFAVIFIAFVSLCNVYFGYLLMDYSTFQQTAITLMQGSMGKFNTADVTSARGATGTFLLIVYLMTIMVVTLNFLVAILNDSFAAADEEDFSTYSEVISYFWESLTSFFVTPSSAGMMKTNSSEETPLVTDGVSKRQPFTAMLKKTENNVLEPVTDPVHGEDPVTALTARVDIITDKLLACCTELQTTIAKQHLLFIIYQMLTEEEKQT